jgi:DNA-binding transcriptional MocR family regulator
MHLWVDLPTELDDSVVALTARRAGVVVLAGCSFYPAEETGSHLRLTFAGVANESDIEAGVLRMARAIPELAG